MALQKLQSQRAIREPRPEMLRHRHKEFHGENLPWRLPGFKIQSESSPERARSSIVPTGRLIKARHEVPGQGTPPHPRHNVTPHAGNPLPESGSRFTPPVSHHLDAFLWDVGAFQDGFLINPSPGPAPLETTSNSATRASLAQRVRDQNHRSAG
jgi:hypothetical protein